MLFRLTVDLCDFSRLFRDSIRKLPWKVFRNKMHQKKTVYALDAVYGDSMYVG